MSTVSLARFLELPADAPSHGLVMQYGYQGAMTIVYRSLVTIERRTLSGAQAGSREMLEARLTVKAIDTDEADSGTYLIIYHDPRRRTVDGRNEPPGARTIVYTKQNEFGEIIESTDATGGVNLMLPRMAVATGSSWREVERFVPPRLSSAVEMVRRYRVASLGGTKVKILFEAEPLSYAADHDDSQGAECTMGGSGEFLFDTQWGVVTRQKVETTLTSSASPDVVTSGPEGDETMMFEVKTTRTLELVD